MTMEELDVKKQLKEVNDFLSGIERFDSSCRGMMSAFLNVNSAIDALGEATVNLTRNPDLHDSVRDAAKYMRGVIRAFKEGNTYYTLNETMHKEVTAPSLELKMCAKRVVEAGKKRKSVLKKKSAATTAREAVHDQYTQDYQSMVTKCNATIPVLCKSLLMATSQYALSLSSMFLTSSAGAADASTPAITYSQNTYAVTDVPVSPVSAMLASAIDAQNHSIRQISNPAQNPLVEHVHNGQLPQLCIENKQPFATSDSAHTGAYLAIENRPDDLPATRMHDSRTRYSPHTVSAPAKLVSERRADTPPMKQLEPVNLMPVPVAAVSPVNAPVHYPSVAAAAAVVEEEAKRIAEKLNRASPPAQKVSAQAEPTTHEGKLDAQSPVHPSQSKKEVPEVISQSPMAEHTEKAPIVAAATP